MISGALCSACSPGCAVPSSWTSTPWVSARVDRDRDRGRDAVYPVHQALGRAPRAPVPTSVDPGKGARPHAGSCRHRQLERSGNRTRRTPGHRNREDLPPKLHPVRLRDYAVATRPYGLVHRVEPGAQRILRRETRPSPPAMDATPTSLGRPYTWSGSNQCLPRQEGQRCHRLSRETQDEPSPSTIPRCRRRAMPGASSATPTGCSAHRLRPRPAGRRSPPVPNRRVWGRGASSRPVRSERHPGSCPRSPSLAPIHGMQRLLPEIPTPLPLMLSDHPFERTGGLPTPTST
jgi:hypothetical protein